MRYADIDIVFSLPDNQRFKDIKEIQYKGQRNEYCICCNFFKKVVREYPVPPDSPPLILKKMVFFFFGEYSCQGYDRDPAGAGKEKIPDGFGPGCQVLPDDQDIRVLIYFHVSGRQSNRRSSLSRQ